MEIVKKDTVSELKSSSNMKGHPKQKKKKILTEEEYTEKMERIITRDFFPDLPKLKAQNSYLDAMQKGDVARLEEIQLTYQLTESTRSRICSVRDAVTTPAPFETPMEKSIDSPTRTEVDDDDRSSVVTVSEKKKQSLDAFLSETTSEDNASFLEVMERSEEAHKRKYPWLHVDEEAESRKVDGALANPPEAIEFKKPELVMWKYKNRNALMYVPDGVPWTTEERLTESDRKVICHSSTRFSGAPHAEEENREAIAEAAALHAKMKEGRVGIDGKEIGPQESPQVNGYGFVSTPMPEPGVNDTPIMTWGEIEGTPFRLDGGDTPLPQNPGGQQFRIPHLSAREKIALSLASDKKRKMASSNPQTNKFGSATPKTSLEKLLGMSPAAQRLAYAKLGIQKGSDRALRASYSPSPLRTPNKTPQQATTPLITTPLAVTSISSPTRPIPSVQKRHKASDFF